VVLSYQNLDKAYGEEHEDCSVYWLLQSPSSSKGLLVVYQYFFWRILRLFEITWCGWIAEGFVHPSNEKGESLFDLGPCQ
jgi:hypothetical protein